MSQIHRQVPALSKISKLEVEELNDRGFIFYGDKLKLRDKGRLLFEEDNIRELFDEFYTTFPIKTPSGRRLRASSLESNNASQAYSIYKRKIRRKEEHDVLMKGLLQDLKERESKGSLEYLNNILTYLRNETWEMFDGEELINDEWVDIG